jgi:hypothetical protein
MFELYGKHKKFVLNCNTNTTAAVAKPYFLRRVFLTKRFLDAAKVLNFCTVFAQDSPLHVRGLQMQYLRLTTK